MDIETEDKQKLSKAEYAREWRKRNPDKVKQHSKTSRLKNKDKIKQRQSEWREQNLEYLKEKSRNWYYDNKERVVDLQMKRKFKISLEEYNSILEFQDHKCYLCGSQDPRKGNRFAIDHNHKTGKVRGLLCMFCNVGLGHFQEDIELLSKAIEYLKYPPEISHLLESEVSDPLLSSDTQLLVDDQ